MSLTIHRTLFAFAMLAGLSGIASAQSTTSSTETKKFEVIAIDGNQLVVKLPEGTREITVANDFRFNVNGQALSLQQLKPGMAGTATITTTTKSTPVTVTEVKNGTVEHSAATTIIVRTDEGFRSFSQGEIDKRGVKIYRAGKPANVADFRPGDKISAVIVTSMPPKVVTQQEVNAQLAASGGAAGAARPPAASAAGTSGGSSASAGRAPAGASGAPAASAAPAASGASEAAGTSGTATRRTLPKTGSPLPLLGLLGGISLLAASGLTMRRFTRR
jgi:LPXTG-motif cell wall-anchored protein